MSVPLFLQVIMERLCNKLEVICDDKKSRHFVEYLAELREAYDQGRLNDEGKECSYDSGRSRGTG